MQSHHPRIAFNSNSQISVFKKARVRKDADIIGLQRIRGAGRPERAQRLRPLMPDWLSVIEEVSSPDLSLNLAVEVPAETSSLLFSDLVLEVPAGILSLFSSSARSVLTRTSETSDRQDMGWYGIWQSDTIPNLI